MHEKCMDEMEWEPDNLLVGSLSFSTLNLEIFKL